MASKVTLVRHKLNKIEQNLRAVARIQTTINEFKLLANSLALEVCAEEDRTKNHDPSHFAYSILATAIIQRRNNIKQSIDKLEIQLDAAKPAQREAIEEWKTAVRLVETDKRREQLEVVRFQIVQA